MTSASELMSLIMMCHLPGFMGGRRGLGVALSVTEMWTGDVAHPCHRQTAW